MLGKALDNLIKRRMKIQSQRDTEKIKDEEQKSCGAKKEEILKVFYLI